VTLEAGQLKPEEAPTKKTELLKTVLFGNGNRTDICWLEFWIYMCADGLEPEVNEVAVDQGILHKPLLIKKKKRLSPLFFFQIIKMRDPSS
jgi:hypothetical protein